jgi:protein involved in sex pheromone biosynthesis
MKKFVSIALVAILSMVLNCGGDPTDLDGKKAKAKKDKESNQRLGVLAVIVCNTEYDKGNLSLPDYNSCMSRAIPLLSGSGSK